MSLPRLLLGLVAGLAVLAAVALPTPTRAASPRSAPSLLAYWPLDEKAGPTLLDTVAARVGTLVGGAVLGGQTARSDDRGGGIVLLGGSAVALDGAPVFPANVTLEVWANPLPGAGGTRYILSRGTGTSGLHLGVDSFNRVVLSVGAASGPTLLTGPIVPAGTWHHVAATVAGRDAALYLDGKLVASRTLTAPPAATARTLYLGRYSALESNYWRGSLDEVSLYDGALDAAAVAARYAAVADVTPPAVRVSAAPPAQSARTDATLRFNATKGASTYSCRLDARAWAPCSESASYSGLAEGQHTASVLATDRYGIAGAGPATVGWNVDLTMPETLLLAARPAPGAAGEASFVSETAAGFECQVDGAPWTACTSPLSAPARATVAVRALDAAGNADPTPATARLAPEGGATPYGSASASFVVAGQRSSALQCRLNAAGWAPCPESLTFTDLPYGANAVSVRDPGLPGVPGAASLAWNAPLPVPSLIAPRFPLLVTFASRRAQRRTKPSRAPRLLYRANTDGAAAVVLRRGARIVGRWTTAFHRGSNTMAFPIDRFRRLGSGRHVLTLEPRNAAASGPALRRRFDVVRLRGR
jgi:concanavalin A-like lectin/glucanase superfamily protein